MIISKIEPDLFLSRACFDWLRLCEQRPINAELSARVGGAVTNSGGVSRCVSTFTGSCCCESKRFLSND